MVAAGSQHSLVVLEDGSVIGFGHNGWGRATSRWPRELGGRAVDVAAGCNHSIALLQCGRVAGWGHSKHGAADCPDFSSTGAVAVAAGACHSLALLSDGTVVGWGSEDHGCTAVPSFGGRRAVAIAAGAMHSLALLDDGTVTGWGSNTHGAVMPPPAVIDAVAIAAGCYSSLAVLRDGSVVRWGAFASTAAPGRPPGRCVSAALGHEHAVYLYDDGSVLCTGSNDKGQASPPPLRSKAVAVSAGDAHSLALLCDGSVVAWGDNENRQATVPSLGGLRAQALNPGVLAQQIRGAALFLMWQRRLQCAAYRLRVGGAGEPVRALPAEICRLVARWAYVRPARLPEKQSACAFM
eukprot:TRINITY_DN35654_c0_g1_i1.p1 TRINITY_DN35654_c0_g1~~TRINITY_DN35654_c0_g1_i1.p1  ORF type:complete len:386 (+),score=122.01 TRINITY_DN35654_c0_g1_i1:108-1160(+)